MARRSAETPKGDSETGEASRSGSQQTREEVAARGGRRVGIYLNPKRNALAGELADALGVDLSTRGGWVRLWDAMAQALAKKVAAKKA
jgi:hypothetical protein